jgi:hypothetical protein
MSDPGKSEIENGCKDLQKAFQGILSWKWDGRFETVLAEFGVKKKDQIRAVLQGTLRNSWEGSSIGKAPAPVQSVSGRLGGLRPGQLLMTSEPQGDAFLFCAWWPWGDEKTISIRIAPAYPNVPPAERAEHAGQLKSWFGI